MFRKKETTVDDWKIILHIIEEYGVDYLIKVFDKLTKFQKYNYSFNDSIYTRYGDQRTSSSRFFNQNDELLLKLTKAKVSFQAKGGDIFFNPEKWIPFGYFLKIMEWEISKKEWTIERYKDVLDKLKESHFDNVSINPDEWRYPHNYRTTLPYLCGNDDGGISMRKIYSDTDFYVREETPSITKLKRYPNMIWEYRLDEKYKREASWYSIVELEGALQRRVYASLHLHSLAIDTSKIPKREEIENVNFDPLKIYNIKSR